MHMLPVALQNYGKFAQNRLLKNLLEKKANYLLRVLQSPKTLASINSINNCVTPLFYKLQTFEYSDNAPYCNAYATNTVVRTISQSLNRFGFFSFVFRFFSAIHHVN